MALPGSSFLLFAIKRLAFRKASAVVIALALAILAIECKTQGQDFLNRIIPSRQTTQAKQETVQTKSQEIPQQSQATQEPEVPEPPAKEADSDSTSQLDQLNFKEGDFDWRQDWWKALILVLGALFTILILLRIARQVFRIVIVTICLAAGTAGAYFFQPVTTPWLTEKLPKSCASIIPVEYWAYFICFMASYLIATIILYILKKPIDIVGKRQNLEDKER